MFADDNLPRPTLSVSTVRKEMGEGTSESAVKKEDGVSMELLTGLLL